jgi:diguanylate cyclase (GGDEF)-like protein
MKARMYCDTSSMTARLRDWRLPLLLVVTALMALAVPVRAATLAVQPPQSLVDISGQLAPAIAGLGGAVETRMKSGAMQDNAAVAHARAELDRVVNAHLLAAGPGASPAQLDEFGRNAHDHLQQSAALLRSADRRSALEREYHTIVDAIAAQIKTSAGHDWKMMGRVVAREYSVELQRAMEDLRLRSERLLVAHRHDPAVLAALDTSIARFAALLAARARQLASGEGGQWLVQLQSRIDQLGSLGHRIAALDRSGNAALADFQSAGLALVSAAHQLYATSPSGSAAATAAPAAAMVRQDGGRWQWSVAAAIMVSLLLLMARPLRRVPAPVRRFMVAMRRRASRGSRAHIQHGEYMQAHDPLTRLPNRRKLVSHLQAVLEQARHAGERVAVLFIDLDDFKTINDSVSHGFGDRVLVSIAEEVSRLAGPTAFVARQGGDEFAVVLQLPRENMDPAGLGHRLLQAFTRSISVDDRELSLSISVGAAVYPEHAGCADTLLSAADAAVFHAKASGRGRLSVFSPLLLEAAAARFRIEQGLRRAIQCGELELLYQPEVSARTLRVNVLEALVRWRMPDGTLAPPGEFLAVAEETGLICDLGHWVLRRAIETAAQWRRDGDESLRVAVNVSARQLLEKGFVARVTDLLAEAGLPARCIELELTENALQTGPETIEVLRALHAAGIAVALDDFGTGYSSLASLERLPLSRVKLDRSLIAGIHTSERARAIMKSVSSLCRKLRFDVVAEGIEHGEQLARLLPEKAMHLQGFLIGKPVGAEQVPGLVMRMPWHMASLLGHGRGTGPTGQYDKSGALVASG